MIIQIQLLPPPLPLLLPPNKSPKPPPLPPHPPHNTSKRIIQIQEFEPELLLLLQPHGPPPQFVAAKSLILIPPNKIFTLK